MTNFDVNNSSVPSDAINDYVTKAAAGFDLSQHAKLVAATAELLRLASGAAVVSRQDPALARIGLIDLLGRLCGIAWEQIPFSITKAALGPESARARLEALKTFVNVAEAAPELANEELFRSLLADAENSAPAPKQPATKQPAKLATDKDIARVFQRGAFRPGNEDPVFQLLNWQSTLANGNLGPTLWAIELAADEAKTTALLETGETVHLPSSLFTLARTTDPEDYKLAPLSLLAHMRAYLEPGSEKLDAMLGQFTQPVRSCIVLQDKLQELSDLFTNPTLFPANRDVQSVTVPVDGTSYSVTIEAAMSATGPYVVAKLLDSAGAVILRCDTPRQFSVRGVYLFPLLTEVISVLVH